MKEFLTISFFLSLTVSLNVDACLNAEGLNNKGQRVRLNDISAVEWKHNLDTPWQKESRYADYVKDVIKDVKKEPTAANKNRLAVSLGYLGKYRESLDLLKHIEKSTPGFYETASNMGTIFELLGDNKNALYWIKEGVRRNSDSHFGSEWLHVLILEAKVAEENGKPLPRTGSVLKLNFGSDVMPVVSSALPQGNDGKNVSLFNLASSITYQLNERTFFVKPKEQIVAGLFFDLGNLELAAGSIEKANVAYEYALKYGYSDQTTINNRRNVISKIISSTKSKKLSEGVCKTCEPPPPPPPPPKKN